MSWRWGRAQKLLSKEVTAMSKRNFKPKEISIQQVIALAANRARREGKQEATVFVPYPYVIGIVPLVEIGVRSPWGLAKVRSKPSSRGWFVRVVFTEWEWEEETQGRLPFPE
jgi:hypothetical protein